MTSFDTNVAGRLLVEDDPAQCERAERAFLQNMVILHSWHLNAMLGRRDLAGRAAALRRVRSRTNSVDARPGRAEAMRRRVGV